MIIKHTDLLFSTFSNIFDITKSEIIAEKIFFRNIKKFKK